MTDDPTVPSSPPSAGPARAEPLDATSELHIGVLLFEGVEPLDFVGPAQAFWTLDHIRHLLPPLPALTVHLVAEHAGTLAAGYDFRVQATTGYAECPPLDVLIVPGGSAGEDDDATARQGRRFQQRHQPTLSFLSRQAEGARMVASVCTGSLILAAAGLLAGRRATTHWAYRDELTARMAERGEPFTLATERVVDDGDLVSAGGVSSGIDLGLHLVGRLLGAPVRDAAALAIEVETPVPAPA